MTVLMSVISVHSFYPEKVNLQVQLVPYVRISALNVPLNVKSMVMMSIAKNVQDHVENVPKNVEIQTSMKY
jgi:hypothetical protein